LNGSYDYRFQTVLYVPSCRCMSWNDGVVDVAVSRRRSFRSESWQCGLAGSAAYPSNFELRAKAQNFQSRRIVAKRHHTIRTSSRSWHSLREDEAAIEEGEVSEAARAAVLAATEADVVVAVEDQEVGIHTGSTCGAKSH